MGQGGQNPPLLYYCETVSGAAQRVGYVDSMVMQKGGGVFEVLSQYLHVANGTCTTIEGSHSQNK